MESIEKMLAFYNSQAGVTNSLWNFYALVVLGLLGFVLTHRDLFKERKNQVFFAVIFVFFSASNAHAMYGSQSILHATGEELNRQVCKLQKSELSKEFKNVLLNEKVANSPMNVMIYHLLLDLFVLGAIFFLPGNGTPNTVNQEERRTIKLLY